MGNCHYIPIHLQPYYRDKGFKKGGFPVAERYYETSVSLPIYPNLTRNEQQGVIDAVCELLV